MTVAASTAKYIYTGDGTSTAFAFPSLFFANGDILVGLDGVLQNSGYTVTGAGNNAGGTVTFSAAPASGVTVVLLRKPTFQQLIDFVNGQTVLEGTLENGLDRLTMMVQYLLDANGRTLRVGDLDVESAAEDLLIPDATTRALKALGFDANGDLELKVVDQAGINAELAAFNAALALRLRVDTAAQELTNTQKTNAKTNLGLAAVASSGSAADLATGTLPTDRLAANFSSNLAVADANDFKSRGLGFVDSVVGGVNGPAAGGYWLTYEGNDNFGTQFAQNAFGTDRWVRTNSLGFGAWERDYTGATQLDARYVNEADYTAADVLTKIKTVDGSGSGLDADLLRGTTPSAFGLSLLDDANAAAALSTLGALASSDYTAADVLTKVKTVDGSGSGLDADLLRGTTPSAFGLSVLDDTTAIKARGTLGVGYVSQIKHLFDYIDNDVIPHADILANTSTADLGSYLQTAINAIPASGGILILPPCDIRTTIPITIGNGTNTSVSSKNGQVIICEGSRGTDDGTFGGGNRAASTRLLYVGSSAPSSYLLTINGPIRNVDIRGLVLDCNGLCGYPIDLTWLIESYIEITGTKWITGQGRARVRDVAMPSGVTIGFFKNVLKIRTKLPWQSGAIKRGTQGFQYHGGPINNQGFSKNVIECEHVFDDLGTYAMQTRFIDNNQFRNVWTRTSTGSSPLHDASLQGTGVEIVVPNAGPLGENTFNGNFGGGNDGSGGFKSVAWAYESGATAANKVADHWQSFALLDYETIPKAYRLAKVYATDGTINGGVTGSMSPVLGRTDANLSTTPSTQWFSPAGQSASKGNRLDAEMMFGREGYVHTFEVYLSSTPGAGATRTIALNINGTDVVSVFFNSGEGGIKRAAVFSPIKVLSADRMAIVTNITGTATSASVSWCVGFCPTEAIAHA